MAHAVHGHGAPAMRVEDERLVTGRGRYVSDWNLPGQLYAHFVRADRAHAEIIAINTVPVAAYRGAGQLLTGSFMDYCMPRAGMIPPIRMEDSPIPATNNNSER